MTKTDNEWKKQAKRFFTEELPIAIALAFLFALSADWLVKRFGKTVIVITVATVLVAVMHRFDVVGRIKRYRAVRRTGLKGILRRGFNTEPNWLPMLFKVAKRGDTADIVGRTNKELLEQWHGLLEGALKSGVRIRLMLLNAKAIANPVIGPRTDLRPLGISGASTLLQQHLVKVKERLKVMKKQVEVLGKASWEDPKNNPLPGSLYVYRTSVLVQNSAVILAPKSGATRVIYDFSFGLEENRKWSHYYEKEEREGSFISQLKEFYSNMFDQYSSLFDYELSYDPTLTIEEVAMDRMKRLIAAHSESESIRENTFDNIMPTAIEIFDRMSQQNTVPKGPVSVQVELTNRCSTKCKHCSRYRAVIPPAPGVPGPLRVINAAEQDLDVALAERLFQDLADLGTKTLTFSGGEPTQHPHFIQLLETAKNAGLEVGVLSNGIGLTEKIRRALDKYASWLRLSIDGSNQATYARVRTTFGEDPSGGFNEVIETLLWFDRRPVQRCKPAICYTILKQNWQDVENMVTFIEREFPNILERLTFKFAHAGNDGNSKAYVCSEDEIDKLYKAVLKNPEFIGKANISYLRGLVEKQFGIAELAEGKPTRSLYLNNRPQCFTPYLFSLIDPKGDVYPCCFLYEDNRSYDASAVERRALHRLGNIKDGFKTVWEGQLYEQTRRELEPIVPEGKYDACSRCTRHCNHNLWLTFVHQEYEQLRTLGEDASKILRAGASEAHERVWL